MATGSINLPAGFQLEQAQDQPSVNLPPGFQLEEPTQPKEPMTFSGGLQNAATDVMDYIQKAPKMAWEASKTLADPTGLLRGNQPSPRQRLDSVGNAIVQAIPHPNPDKPLTPLSNWEPGGLLENVAHPYDHPVKAALDIGSVIAPFLGEAKVAEAPSLLSKTAEAPGLFQRTAAKTLSLLGPEEDALLARMKNPEAIKQAGTIADVSNTLPGVAEKFNTVIGHLSDEADKVISKSNYLNEGALTKDEVLGAVSRARKNLGGIYTDESKTAAKTLERIGGKFKNVRETVSQNQTRTIIRDLDNEIPWTKVWKAPENLTATDHALMDIRTQLDGVLKAKNPKYADLMKPVSDAIQSRGEFLKRFNIEKIKGKGYQLGDNTVNRAANTLNENKVASQRVLGDVQDTTGEDVLSKLQNAKYKEQFQSPTSHTLDDILRTSPETFVTMIQNKFGREIAGKIADLIHGAGSAIRSTNPTSLFKGAGAANAGARVLDEETIAKYMAQNDNDPKKAAQAAEADGYQW